MSSDAKLQKSVLDELKWDPSVMAGHIGVSAEDGIITLTGHVHTYAEKSAAVDAAERVKGVLGVADEIEVRLAPDTVRHDDEIARAAAERLMWNVNIPRDAVKIEVENGWITLSGQVKWNYQKDAAEGDLRHLYGVKGLTNKIAIAPTVNVALLSDDITHALHRSWFFDPKTIDVTAVGGNVHLKGHVRSPHERLAAAAVAWAAPGVTSVRNDLTVQ